MRLPTIRAMRLNAPVPAVASARADAAVGLNKSGLFSATLGAVTSGSSRDDKLELTHLGRQSGIKEEDKKHWEGFQLGVCGLATTDFRSALDEVKRVLQDAGLSMENVRVTFNHAIIGFPRSKELLAPMKSDLLSALLNAGLGVDCRVGVKSDMLDFIAYQNEAEVWDVYSAVSAELQLERTQTYNTPELRAQYLRQLDQLIEQAKVEAEEVATCREVEKEASPCESLEKRSFDPVAGKKRCRDEGVVLTATKAARVGRERNRATVHPINLIDLLEKVADKDGQ